MVAEQWQIDDLGDKTNMAICIASSKAIWEPFFNFIRDIVKAKGEIPINPLDTYIGDKIISIIIECKEKFNLFSEFKVYNDWNQNDACHLQTMGELTSIAIYSPPPVMWSTHCKYGIWFAFRAVVVFGGLSAPSLIIPKAVEVSPCVIQQLSEAKFTYSERY